MLRVINSNIPVTAILQTSGRNLKVTRTISFPGETELCWQPPPGPRGVRHQCGADPGAPAPADCQQLLGHHRAHAPGNLTQPHAPFSSAHVSQLLSNKIYSLSRLNSIH
jgi:hypothetical protein